MSALFALLGAGTGLGLWLATTHPRPDRPHHRWPTATVLRVAVVLATAAVTGAVSGMPVAAVLAAVGVWLLPRVLGPDLAHRRTLHRVEAVAAWAEDLAGTLAAAAGLEQAILQTAGYAPEAIRPQLHTLTRALHSGVRLPTALRALAVDLADPAADLLIHVLLQAARHEARDLGTTLSAVARTARRHASMRMRVAAGRARTRTSVRIVVTVVASVAAGSAVFARDLMQPYHTPAGQLVLATLGAGFTAALAWLVRTARVPDPPRILTHPPESR